MLPLQPADRSEILSILDPTLVKGAQLQKVGGVGAERLLPRTFPPQFTLGELLDALQEAQSGKLLLVQIEEGLGSEPIEELERLFERSRFVHRRRRLDGEASLEDGRLGEERTLRLVEEVPGQVERLGQRVLLRRGGGAKELEALIEAGEEHRGEEHPNPRRSQLDRERHPIEAADQILDEVELSSAQLQVGAGLVGQLEVEGDRVLLPHRSELEARASLQGEGDDRGHHDLELGAAPLPSLDHGYRSGLEGIGVVQEQEHRAPGGDRSGQVLLALPGDLEGPGDGGDEVRGAPAAGEVAEPGPPFLVELPDQLPAHPAGQAGLSHPGGAREDDERHPSRQELPEETTLSLASDERASFPAIFE